MHEPEKNSCEISNTKLDFVEIQKEAEEATDALTSALGTDGSISAEAIEEAQNSTDGGSTATTDTVDIDGGDAVEDDVITIDGGDAYN